MIKPKLKKGPKQSQEMREALRLVASGMTHNEAAARAGVSRDGIQKALRKIKGMSMQAFHGDEKLN